MAPAGVIDNLQFCVFHRYESLENHRVVIWRPTSWFAHTVSTRDYKLPPMPCGLWPDQASLHTRGCRHSHAHTSASASHSICEYLFILCHALFYHDTLYQVHRWWCHWIYSLLLQCLLKQWLFRGKAAYLLKKLQKTLFAPMYAILNSECQDDSRLWGQFQLMVCWIWLIHSFLATIHPQWELETSHEWLQCSHVGHNDKWVCPKSYSTNLIMSILISSCLQITVNSAFMLRFPIPTQQQKIPFTGRGSLDEYFLS